MALSPAQRDALIRAEQSQRMLIRERLVDYTTATWNSLGSWRDADIQRFVDRILPRVLAGQKSVAGLTDAYLARVLGSSPVGTIDTSALRGVDPSEVYQRPAVAMRTALSQGKSFTDALAAGAARLASLVVTDLQLANTHQASEVLGSSGAAGFRRTLTGNEDCALCVIASTQRYHRGNLLPMHPGCDCGVAPLKGGEPVPQVIDSALLNATHQQVAEFTGTSDAGARDLGNGKKTSSGKSVSDYTDLIITREHGELGPVLAWRGQTFTSAADL